MAKKTDTGLYAQFVKVLAKGSIQPWERDAFAPTERDQALWKSEEHRNTVLAGGLEVEEDDLTDIQAEEDNAAYVDDRRSDPDCLGAHLPDQLAGAGTVTYRKCLLSTSRNLRRLHAI